MVFLPIGKFEISLGVEKRCVRCVTSPFPMENHNQQVICMSNLQKGLVFYFLLKTSTLLIPADIIKWKKYYQNT